MREASSRAPRSNWLLRNVCSITTHGFLFFAQRVQDFIGGDGSRIDAHADGVENRIRNRGNRRGERAFAGLLRAEGAFRIDTLDDDRLDLGIFLGGWNAIFEQ